MEEERIEIPVPELPGPLRIAVEKHEPGRQGWASAVSEGFPSEEVAWEAGTRARDALLLAGAILKTGFDCGKNRTTFQFGQVVKDSIRSKFGVNLMGNVHGVMTYPLEPPPMFGAAHASGHAPIPHDRLVEAVSSAFATSRSLGDKEKVALEVFGQSRFVTRPQARFIMLVTAVECLAPRSTSAKSIQGFVDEAVTTAKAIDLCEAEKNSLLGRLRDLKKESISRSCHRFVEEYLGPEAGKQFKHWYDIRSKLVHTGATTVEARIEKELTELEDCVARLLVSAIRQ